MDGRKYRRIDNWMAEWALWMVGWMDGWMDGWIDGWQYEWAAGCMINRCLDDGG